MNPYEESELEARDLYCDHCWKLISSHEHYEYCGLCDQCYEIMYMGEWRKLNAADCKSVEF